MRYVFSLGALVIFALGCAEDRRPAPAPVAPVTRTTPAESPVPPVPPPPVEVERKKDVKVNVNVGDQKAVDVKVESRRKTEAR